MDSSSSGLHFSKNIPEILKVTEVQILCIAWKFPLSASEEVLV